MEGMDGREEKEGKPDNQKVRLPEDLKANFPNFRLSGIKFCLLAFSNS